MSDPIGKRIRLTCDCEGEVVRKQDFYALKVKIDKKNPECGGHEGMEVWINPGNVKVFPLEEYEGTLKEQNDVLFGD